MSEKGWIRLYRSVMENSIWQDKPFSKGQAWIDLLLLASYETKKILQGNSVIEILPGQIITSEVTLAERWGWGRKKVSNFLKLLEAEQQIKYTGTAKGTAVTIVKWGSFQIPGTAQGTSKEQLRNSSGNSKGTAKGTALDNDESRMNTAFAEERDEERNSPRNSKGTAQGAEKEQLLERKKEEVNNNSIGGGYINKYIYTPLPPTETIQPLPEITQEQIGQIVAAWNAIPHTVNLSGIYPMAKRYDELRIVIAMVGYEGVLRAIQRVKDSEWLKRKGHAAFDTFIANRDNIQKTMEGNFDKDFETERKPKTSPQETKFNSFRQRDYDYDELERKLRAK